MHEATAPAPDALFVGDIQAFVTAARDWLKKPATIEPEFDRAGAALALLDRVDEMQADLVTLD